MASTSTSFASFEEALTVERIRIERALYRLVLARLARSELGGGIAGRLMARFEAEVVHHAQRTEGDTSPGRLDHVREMAAQAPEPYRTMLVSHLERFEGINDELCTGTASSESGDSLDLLAAEIAYRAARGALAGSIAPELASFVRKHGP